MKDKQVEIDLKNIALMNLRQLKSVVRQREEAVKEAERRLAKAQRDFERALDTAIIPGVTPKQLREIMRG